jgi:hypothetical protein
MKLQSGAAMEVRMNLSDGAPIRQADARRTASKADPA